MQQVHADVTANARGRHPTDELVREHNRVERKERAERRIAKRRQRPPQHEEYEQRHLKVDVEAKAVRQRVKVSTTERCNF